MNDLIERYRKRIDTLIGMIKTTKDKEEVKRLKVKLGCYRAFLRDLQLANEN